MTDGRAGVRLRVLAGLVVLMFAALTTRLWFLQVLAYEQNARSASDNAVHFVDVPAPRGQILDDTGNVVLVGNRESIQVTIDRQVIGSQTEGVLFRLSELLGVKVSVLVARMQDKRYSPTDPVPVAVDVQKRAAFYIMEHRGLFQGVGIAKVPVRTYPEGSLAAHVLGYLGFISSEKLKDPAFANYGPNDRVGVAGVESIYEHDLRGTNGVVKYRVNSSGHILDEIGRVAPVPGNDLKLTLDATIQRLAEDSLSAGIKYARTVADTSTPGQNLHATGGTVIVMDPTTGAIEALASYPTFQPSLFVRTLTDAEFQSRFTASTNYPLLDRAIQGQYAPGSTFKPFVALSALYRGLANMGTSYPCPPTYMVPKDPNKQIFSNWTPLNLGYMTLAGALVQSCDTIFYPLGYKYWETYYPPTTPPHEPLQKDLSSDGFGRHTGIDLPGEQSGRVPSPEWKASIHEQFPKSFPEGQWFPGDFVNMSIGQGDTLVTPLQLATGYSAIMNDGHVCVPHVGLDIQQPNGKVVRNIRSHCNRTLPYSQAEIAYVRNALTGVVSSPSGTASYAFSGFPFSQVWVAGKTGTAQVYGKQDTSWFAAMAKAQGKEYVVVALVEQGGHGSTTAAPIVRHVIEGLFGLPFSPFAGSVAD